jgi:hypothetical protein
MAVFREICSPAPRSRSEIVLRLTPSLRAKSAWDISARRRPWATWTGETKTEAVTQAFRERLQCTRRARTKRRLADDLFIAKAQVSLIPVDENRPTWRGARFANMARAAIRPVSTSETASRTSRQQHPKSRFYSGETTSHRRCPLPLRQHRHRRQQRVRMYGEADGPEYDSVGCNVSKLLPVAPPI